MTNDVKASDNSEAKPPEFSHSQPVHVKPAPSILSSDNTEGLSLRGFGNLGRTILNYNSSKICSSCHDIWQSATYCGELRQSIHPLPFVN